MQAWAVGEIAYSRERGAGVLSAPKGGSTPGKVSGRSVRTPLGHFEEFLRAETVAKLRELTRRRAGEERP